MTNIKIKEQAAADADTTAYGQIWVKDATPNTLQFTDDAGTDTQLGGGGSGLPTTPDFESAEQTVAVDTTLSVAHSLGEIPGLWMIIARCKTAEHGYSIGDELIPFNPSDTGASDRGVNFSVEASNMLVQQGALITMLSQATKNLVTMTVGSWKWVMRAWKTT